MPKAGDSLRVPSYRRHKPSGQAVVTLSGRDIYLGKWNTRQSRAEYDRVIGKWLTGCRPAEVCIIRPIDVDTSGDVWIYRPESHKTEHHGRERVICISPHGQTVLRPYLLRPAESYCFVPAESERRRRIAVHDQRRIPLSCGNRPGTNRKRQPKRQPGERYDTNAYRRAIHRAVAKANRKRIAEAKQNRTDLGEVDLLPKWSPNRRVVGVTGPPDEWQGQPGGVPAGLSILVCLIRPASFAKGPSPTR